MIYVMSDLNGNLDGFQQMMKKIRFRKSDELYVLGNSIDVGPDSIPLLQEMMTCENVYPLLGYREYRFLKCFHDLPHDAGIQDVASYLTPEQATLFSEWVSDGGMSTITQYLELDSENRLAVMEYLEECMPYDVVESCNKSYLLTSSGIRNYAPDKLLEEYPVKAFISGMTQQEMDRWYSDQILVFGTIPVTDLPYALRGMIYFSDNYIAINCNGAHPEDGGRLGCLRLGDERDFYVD